MRCEPNLSGTTATPVLEHYKMILSSSTVTVSNTAMTALPASNAAYRKAIIIQNKSSNNLYFGSGEPYVFIGKRQYTLSPVNNKLHLKWYLSGNGTNEWYVATDDKDGTHSDPGLTQVRALDYATIGGVETAGTNGTVSSLAAEHGWGWGDGDTLGYNTLYIRTNGSSEANNPSKRYEAIIGYYCNITASDSAATGGIKLGPNDFFGMSLDSNCRVFGIGSAANTYTAVMELG
jgi:hypothetical protein